MNATETLTTGELLDARALLESPDARDRHILLLGTRIGRAQVLDALDNYTAENVARFVNHGLGTPPWITRPIAGHDYPLTNAQRVAMFPPLATAA
ncbi:hypothetical protein [Kocuria rhizophila]|uniref:hypothetical protein n=1 Tax=Kocuria rhizophila TaxID=72000 RepID=UPI001EF516EF|nr:hypothetical protein [Kocuria rhizophila]MCG7425249.1 hypothetical protein [Kocuria rhizophila]